MNKNSYPSMAMFVRQHFFQGMNNIPSQYYRTLSQMIEDFAFHSSREIVIQLSIEANRMLVACKTDQDLRRELIKLDPDELPNSVTESQMVITIAAVASKIANGWDGFIAKREAELKEFRESELRGQS